MTNVELYEALKGSISEDAARMIAEAFHPAKDLATKQDLKLTKRDLKLEVSELRGEMREEFTSVRGEIAELRAEIRALPTMKWMFGAMVPVWLGAWGTVVAVILKG